MTKKRKIIIGAAVAVLALAGGAFALGLFDKKEIAKKETPHQKYYSQLTGEETTSDIAARPILGIMIENSEEARPQTGLDSAGIVFEAVTEGGITRYLLLYQKDIPEIVGPVRSIRPHFVDWLMGFDSSIAHVGGSEEALALSDSRKAKSLSQFKYDAPYFRDNNRAAPHNMYARTKDLRALQAELQHKTSKFEEIPRKADSPGGEPNTTTPAAPKVTIDFSSPAFAAEFRYDSATNSYLRFLAGEPHIDSATNKQISVKNLVVLLGNRQENGINALGEGEALVFMDGKVQKAKWQNPSYTNRLRILDKDNKQIPLNRGDSWFAAVATDRPITY